MWHPPVEVAADTLEKSHEIQGIQWTKMIIEQRQVLLFQQLDLFGLDKWSDNSQVAAEALLAEYYDIFSQKP